MHLVFDPPAPLWHYFPFSSDVELYLRPLTTSRTGRSTSVFRFSTETVQNMKTKSMEKLHPSLYKWKLVDISVIFYNSLQISLHGPDYNIR